MENSKLILLLIFACAMIIILGVFVGRVSANNIYYVP